MGVVCGGGRGGGVSGSDDNFPRILRAARRMKPRGVSVCTVRHLFQPVSRCSALRAHTDSICALWQHVTDIWTYVRLNYMTTFNRHQAQNICSYHTRIHGGLKYGYDVHV